jgi:FkbM family methyltransferase
MIHLRSYSQSRQDAYLYQKYFQGKNDGVFVEVGAHDGVTYSNTLLFEKLGWKGVLIEPIPEVFDKLVKNRKGTCINKCAYSHNGEVEFNLNKGYSEMLSGVRDCYDERHYKRLQSEQLRLGGETQIIKCKCCKLTDELTTLKIGHVDLLSIDVEGGEQKVLEGLDLKAIDVRVILIEDNYPDRFGPIDQLLQSYGYKHKYSIGIDKVYDKE